MKTEAHTQFPGFVAEVGRLVEEHRQLTDEPLLMAIYYKPGREPEDIFLFEVIENFGGGAVDPDHQLFEVTYSSTRGFPLEPGQQLHLVLTNPQEYDVAVREHWPIIAELRTAIQAGDFQTLYVDPGRPDLPAKIDA